MKPAPVHVLDSSRRDARGRPVGLCSRGDTFALVAADATCGTCRRAAGLKRQPYVALPRPAPIVTPIRFLEFRTPEPPRPELKHGTPRPRRALDGRERTLPPVTLRPKAAPKPEPAPERAPEPLEIEALAKLADAVARQRERRPQPIATLPKALPLRLRDAPVAPRQPAKACTDGGTAHRWRIRFDPRGEVGVCRHCGAERVFAERLSVV
jgi:hypothetical protein